MAENKKSFILYTDLIHVVRKLVLKDRENNTNYAGELFLHILEYVNDTDPIPINFIVEMSFEPIKQTLKRDLMKYRVSLQKQIESGILGNLKRWHKDLYTKVINNEIDINEANMIAKHRKSSPPDSPPIAPDRTRSHSIGIIADSDSDSDSDITKRKNIIKNSFFNFRKELINLGAEEQIAEDWLKVRKEKKASNTETAFRLFVKQLEKSKKGINEVLEICIENSWKGFKAEWIKNKNNKQDAKKRSASDIILERNGLI